MRIRQIALSLALGLAATGASALDLLGAYQLAVQKDPAFQAEKDALQGAQEILPQAKAGLLPRVSLSGAYNHLSGARSRAESELVNGKLQSVVRARDYAESSKDFRVNLSQPLFRPASYFQYKQAKVQTQYAEVRFDSARTELMRRVSEVYFKALLADENLRLADAEVAALEAVNTQAARLYEKGVGTVTDKHEAEARRLRAQAAQLKARSDRNTAYRTLAATVGEQVEQAKALRGDASLPELDNAELSEWLKTSEQANSKIASKQLEYDYQKAELSKTRSQHLPTLELVASYNINRDPGSTSYLRNDYRSIGVQLSVPLYAGGELNSRSRQRLSDVSKAEHELQAAKSEISTEVGRLLGELQAGKQEVSALKQAVEAAAVVVESNKRSQQGGVRTFVDVLNAERDLYSARRELTRAKFDYLLKMVELKATAGRLNENDLSSINLLLG